MARRPDSAETLQLTSVDYAFNIWDWNIAWLDYELYQRVIDQITILGFTKVELGVPWHSVEESPGDYDFSNVDRRLDYARKKDLDCRFRVNVQDPPAWFSGDVSRLPDGSVFDKDYGVDLSHRAIPSFFDDAGIASQLRWVEAVGRHFGGNRFEYTLGVGLHFELKLGGWNTYEAPAQTKFRQWLTARYHEVSFLNAAWGTAFSSFDSISAPIPGRQVATGISTPPDLENANLDWIRFREEVLASVVVQHFDALRRGDPTCQISAPLGEGFRQGAAEFANQDIYGLSRGADNVVFSYDFFIHSPHDLPKMGQMVRLYADITGRPIKVELDGVATGTYHRYGDQAMFEFAVAALDAGAVGINVANYTQERRFAGDLSQFPFMGRLGAHINALNQGGVPARLGDSKDTLIYLSKWTQYCFRGETEWLHSVQLGFDQVLRAAGRSTRFVTDENLVHEDLSRYELLVLPCDVVIDAAVLAALAALAGRARTLVDLRCAESVIGSELQARPSVLPGPLSTRTYRDVRSITVAMDRLIAGSPSLRVELVPASEHSPTVEVAEIDGAEAIATADGDLVIWIQRSPARTVFLGFSPSATYLAPLIRSLVEWLLGDPDSRPDAAGSLNRVVAPK